LQNLTYTNRRGAAVEGPLALPIERAANSQRVGRARPRPGGRRFAIYSSRDLRSARSHAAACALSAAAPSWTTTMKRCSSPRADISFLTIALASRGGRQRERLLQFRYGPTRKNVGFGMYRSFAMLAASLVGIEHVSFPVRARSISTQTPSLRSRRETRSDRRQRTRLFSAKLSAICLATRSLAGPSDKTQTMCSLTHAPDPMPFSRR
jgi:hypothetical protein